MGDGEFSGNGSVYWSIDHEDGADLKVKVNDSSRPPKNGTTNVHTKTKANGRDPIPVADVGTKKGHPGKFRVTLRFQSEDAAKAASKGATPVFDDQTRMWTLQFDVPAIARQNPDDAPAKEIRVDW
jgi:hypothetical protein